MYFENLHGVFVYYVIPEVHAKFHTHIFNNDHFHLVGRGKNKITQGAQNGNQKLLNQIRCT